MPRGTRGRRSSSNHYVTGTQHLIYEQATLRGFEKAKKGKSVKIAILPETPHPGYPLLAGGLLNIHSEVLPRGHRGTVYTLPPESIIEALRTHAEDLYGLTKDERVRERAQKLLEGLEKLPNALEAHKEVLRRIFQDLGLNVEVLTLDDYLGQSGEYWKLVERILLDPDFRETYSNVVREHPIAKRWGFRPGIPLLIIDDKGRRRRVQTIRDRGDTVELWMDRKGRDIITLPKKDIRRAFEEKGVFPRVSGPLLPIAVTMVGGTYLVPSEQYIPLSSDIARNTGLPEPRKEYIPPSLLIEKYRIDIPKLEEQRERAARMLRALEEVKGILEKKPEELVPPDIKMRLKELEEEWRNTADWSKKRRIHREIRKTQNESKRRAEEERARLIKEVFRKYGFDVDKELVFVRKGEKRPMKPTELIRALKLLVEHGEPLLHLQTYHPVNLLTLYLLGVLHDEVESAKRAR